MLLVKTYLDKSLIHGIRLFAAEPIKEGAVIWDISVLDLHFSKHVVQNMNDLEKKFIKTYGYLDGWSYVICGDDARFMNHSLTPNTKNGEGDKTLASKDIQIGEEITCNYYEIDDAAQEKIGHRLQENNYLLCSESVCGLSSISIRKL